MKFAAPKIIKNSINKDQRGTLQEIFKKNNLNEDFIFSLLVECKKDVFRGLHFQFKKQQAKIVVIGSGKIIDYCLDLRKKISKLLKVFIQIKKEIIFFIYLKGLPMDIYLCQKILKLYIFCLITIQKK